MKINISIILLLMLAALNGCSVSKTVAENSGLNQNTEVGDNKTGETENAALKEVFSNDGDFKFKMPCDLSKRKDEDEKEFIGKEKTHTQVCDANRVKVSVSSRKSKVSLREEFEKLKTEEKVEENKFNGIPFIEYTKWSETTTTEINDFFGKSKETKFQITKTKLYLVNDNWTINFEVLCNSTEQSYCENVFAERDGTASKFFDSLELLK